MLTVIAKKAIPFVKTMVYDQWLGLVAAMNGSIVCIDQPLVRHRIHDINQTLTLNHIHSKQDYYEKRVLPFAKRMDELRSRIELGHPQRDAEEWQQARMQLHQHQSGAWRRLLALRRVNPKITCFELAMPLMPAPLFRLAIRMIQKGTI